MGDRSRGLYGKFDVSRTDGSSEPGGKHEGCDYFVLDITHDTHAIPTLCANAASAREDGYGLLADDLEFKIDKALGEKPLMNDDVVVWQGGQAPTGPSRYDMNLDQGAFPGGRWDLTKVTADEVDGLIDSQGGERRLDALLAIAEDAGVAAGEIAFVQKMATQLIKLAIRAAKAAS